ncbi:MAG: hypothetical protein WAV51_05075 [Microgenomates group bacterium]
MQKLVSFLRCKPFFFFWITLIYIVFVYVVKWNIHPTIQAGLFIVGGLIGMYFLEAAERFVHLNPSPFRSIVFVALFLAVSFFVVTSSVSYIASGLVLSIFLTLILWQFGEWSTAKNLHRWYVMLADPVSPRAQVWILCFEFVFFVFQTIIFIQKA